MIIEGLITIAILLAEETIQPSVKPEPPAVCYEDTNGEFTCYPVDQDDKLR